MKYNNHPELFTVVYRTNDIHKIVQYIKTFITWSNILNQKSFFVACYEWNNNVSTSLDKILTKLKSMPILSEVRSVGSVPEPPQEFNLTSNFFSIDFSNQENKVLGRKGSPEASVSLSIATMCRFRVTFLRFRSIFTLLSNDIAEINCSVVYFALFLLFFFFFSKFIHFDNANNILLLKRGWVWRTINEVIFLNVDRVFTMYIICAYEYFIMERFNR